MDADGVRDAYPGEGENADEINDKTRLPEETVWEPFEPFKSFEPPEPGPAESSTAPFAAAEPYRERSAPERFYSETVRHETYARQDSRFRKITALVLAASLLGGAALGFGFGAGRELASGYWLPRMKSDKDALRQYTLNVSTGTAGYLSSGGEAPLNLSYADILESVEPAVVTITSIHSSGYYTYRSGGDSVGAGTGMLFHETDNKYYIATNAHVVSGAASVYVSIENSQPIPAAPVGKDESADVAVISVDKTDAYNAGITSVKLVTFGDSDAARVGDVVLTIGNALGAGNASTNGIISAKDRVIPIDGVKFTVIQTNAAVNKGNSGGPLINLSGEVIGMNTAKLQESNVEGMGYSIPSKIIMPIIEKIMRGGKALMGVVISDVSDAYRETYASGLQSGALIKEIVPGGAADKAGLLIDDVVTALDDTPITGMSSLIDTVADRNPGDNIRLTIVRGRETFEVELTLNAAEPNGF